MANQEIAYKIIVDTSKAAQQILDLEAEIKRLKQELQTIPQDSQAFDTITQAVQGLENQLSGVITEAQRTGDVIVNESNQASTALDDVSASANKAGTSIEDVGKKTKNISFEKAFQSFVKVGSAVTSSFAAAQAAIGLFGGDTTKVAEAAAKAQNALTLAIAAREVAEGLGAITTVRATIAQKAKNIADTASIGILKRLFLLIASNPLIALATAIGLVVVAIYNLVDAETAEEKQAKQTADALKSLNEELDKVKRNSDLGIDRINNLTEALRLGKITAEEYTAGLKNFISNIEELQQYLTGTEINTFLNNQTEILKILDQISKLQTTLNSDELKNDKIAQQVTQNEIERLDIELAKRQSVNNGLLKLVEDRKKAEADAAEQNRKIAEENRQLLLQEIRLKSELEKLQISLLDSQQKLGDINVQLQTTEQLELLRQLTKSTDEYLTVTQKLQKLTADYSESDAKRIKEAEDQLTNFGEKIKNLDKLLAEGFAQAKVTLQSSDLRGLLQKQFDIQAGLDIPLEDQISNASRLINFQIKFIDQYTNKRLQASKNTGEALREEEAAYRSEAEALFNTLVENEKGLISYQSKVKKLKEELANAAKETDRLKKSSELLNAFLRGNVEDIVKQYEFDIPNIEEGKAKAEQIQVEFDKKTLDQNRRFGEDVVSLENQLLKQGFDIRQASYEDKLKLLQTFIQKEVEAFEKGEKDKQEIEKTRLDKFKENIQAFQSALNTLQQTVTLFYDSQFNQLEKRYKRLQDTITGESEAANQKRIEAEKAYNEEKEKLEKQAAKASLRISLAQAAANTAEAVTKVTAELGPVGLIAAGAVIAFNAAQVAIIANQLANIDNYRRGGRIKMGMGGLVQGPAHEYGGVKFQGGGIELEGNEAVINRVSTVNYMGLLDQINQAGGGKPIGNFDDSRIVEAIAKQRNTPIRAYVVESDITAKQTTARKLQELATF